MTTNRRDDQVWLQSLADRGIAVYRSGYGTVHVSCFGCSKDVALTRNGKLWKHEANPGRTCSASGHIPTI